MRATVAGMGETIEIQAPDGAAEAYLTGERGHPGVLLYIDAIGLRPQIEAMADRIASWGYVVLAPNVFYRSGRAADLAPTADLREPGARRAFFAGGVMTRVHALTPDLSGPDARAWLDTLTASSAPGPIGVTGYCMGARLAVRTGGWFPGTVAAVGGFHGGDLVSACHVGANLVPVEADEDDARVFAQRALSRGRSVSTVVGPQHADAAVLRAIAAFESVLDVDTVAPLSWRT